MTTRSKLLLSTLPPLLAVSLGNFPVYAANKSEPVYIESDSLQMEENEGSSYFKGRVKFKQGDLVIYADSIRTKNKNGNLDRVVIKGKPIKMNQRSAGKQPISASANKIEYFADGEIVHLYGDALLQQGAQQFRGEHIKYDSRNHQVIANGNQQTGNSHGQGRVKAVIMPKTKNGPNTP